MRMRNPKDKDFLLETCDYYFNGSFSDSHGISLEIGMGKGKFILDMALKYPNINYIGLEKYSSVASRAIKKINEYKPKNLKIMIGDIADNLETLEKKIDTIYLNFSDPWPKDRHAKRRLTSIEHLKMYDNLFKGRKRIVQKTDNDDLFAYSLECFKEYGYEIVKISYDLHNDDIPNITTEYEEKFSKQGIKIKYVEVVKND